MFGLSFEFKTENKDFHSGCATTQLVFFFGPNLYPQNLRFGFGPSQTISNISVQYKAVQ